ncbi:hypothetical protein F8568_025570 [Actinomadura sp. LD22]|uniref:Uncharacterized protein n=1 Tax=Actinomadura physcomitrii TaxID=2650748 RepID=A0A6I4MDA0_9ACTN|nr:hypothetical protein [Actinomadura physcomitrii]MWA03692.1 hypothetical protein [Actinomadura physcomitrii]
MSGPRDTRETAEEAGTAAAPAASAPPSFGAAPPEGGSAATEAAPASQASDDETAAPAPAAGAAADEAPSASAPFRLPPFGLQTPWWAAEPAADTNGAGGTAGAGAAAPETAEASDDADTTASGEAEAPDDTVPPGTLVAGVGVPSIDSRRAVPSEPLRKRPLAFGDTDPDGFAPVRPDEDAAPKPAPSGTDGEAAEDAPPPSTATGPMGIAPPLPAKDDEPAAPAEPAAEAERSAPPAAQPAAQPAAPPAAQPAAQPAPRTQAKAAASLKTAEEPRPAPEPPSPPRDAADGMVAFEKAMEAEKAAAAVAPVLVPDAILPPGVLPPTGSGPYPHTDASGATATAEQPAMATVITPVYHAEGGVPLDEPGPAGSGGPGGPSAPGTRRPRRGGGRQRIVLVGGGAGLVLAALVALFLLGGTGSKGDGATRKDAEPTRTEPTRSGSAAPKPSTPPKPRPVDINDEKTDPKDLSFTEAFPQTSVNLGSRAFDRDRWSVNKDLGYAARGSMLKALQQENCRKIVRATFINKIKTWAVTTGIAVMPNRAAALRVSRAGDPAAYEWFRGMSGKQTNDIDRAGGYAAVTVRGRYVIYAYVQDPGGHQVKPGDKLAKQIAQQFLGYSARPIEARAHG